MRSQYFERGHKRRARLSVGRFAGAAVSLDADVILGARLGGSGGRVFGIKSPLASAP